MYFVRSGYIYIQYGSLWYAGYAGYAWSPTAYPADSQNAFYLFFNPTRDSASAGYDRYGGLSLHLIIIALPSISSVVAVLVFHTTHSGTQAMLASSGPPSPTLLHLRTPSTPTSILTTSSPPIYLVQSDVSKTLHIPNNLCYNKQK